MSEATAAAAAPLKRRRLSGPTLLVAALPFLWIAAGMTAELSRAGSTKTDRLTGDRIDGAFAALEGLEARAVKPPIRFVTTETRQSDGSILQRQEVVETH